jgi:hypothetical protein
MVRTYSAGVFAGELESRNGQEVVMRNARRMWHWEGAASLSELAMHGTALPELCLFPCEVDRVELLETIEIIDITDKARANIKRAPVWGLAFLGENNPGGNGSGDDHINE